MTKTWIVEKVNADGLAKTLNRLEQEAKGADFELHGIYPTGDHVPGSGGFADKQPEFLIVGTHTQKPKAMIGR